MSWQKQKKEAVIAIEERLEKTYGPAWKDNYSVGGWGTDYYTLEERERGQVLINAND